MLLHFSEMLLDLLECFSQLSLLARIAAAVTERDEGLAPQSQVGDLSTNQLGDSTTIPGRGDTRSESRHRPQCKRVLRLLRLSRSDQSIGSKRYQSGIEMMTAGIDLLRFIGDRDVDPDRDDLAIFRQHGTAANHRSGDGVYRGSLDRQVLPFRIVEFFLRRIGYRCGWRRLWSATSSAAARRILRLGHASDL